jgi:hypothetical protein
MAVRNRSDQDMKRGSQRGLSPRGKSPKKWSACDWQPQERRLEITGQGQSQYYGCVLHSAGADFIQKPDPTAIRFFNSLERKHPPDSYYLLSPCGGSQERPLELFAIYGGRCFLTSRFSCLFG